MKFAYQITPAIIGATVALVQTQVAVALSASEVNNVAKQITVLIQSKKPRYGSGVIIKKDGNTYTVLTAAHVVEVKDNYEIILPNGRRYAINYSSVKQLPGVDLAVVQFSSNQKYNVAKIGNSDSSSEGTTAYVAGFPAPTFAINQSIYTFSDGRITANTSKPLRDGYALVYSNNTSEGMSGGAVLNDKGELIAIHGRADKDAKEIKTGFNLGIPINTFLRLSARTGVDTGVSAPNTSVAKAPKAGDFYIQAGDKYDKGDYQGAIADYTQAISLNPKYTEAYYNRGNARSKLKDLQGAIADYNLAIKNNPNFAYAYFVRGIVRAELGDAQGAIADFTLGLKIDPNYAYGYIARGITYHVFLNNKQAAIADYTLALKIDPNFATAYHQRGLVRYYLEDYKGAIPDFDSAIKINPNHAQAYYRRGLARYYLEDKQGAIVDYTAAIKINPNYAQAYYFRGMARTQLGDKQGAIADFDSAIKINPNDAYTHNQRGLARAQLGDKQGAISDLQKAANIYQQEGKSLFYQDAINNIRQLQQ
ncbi:Tetratricopeptide TPR_2 repeat protein [Nostoc sp. NIES-3756]|uniref:serine protease n=1 Tax=Nostoc sp. NIES-3756 TaxID=1751286 RepID=UPI000720492C|nr:serine protease [Nostoc sp. NIES-3756]BAT51540.1 Tetratricopeptide TPR_2 repeat protein [Nostoc sp. NIES-3756]